MTQDSKREAFYMKWLKEQQRNFIRGEKINAVMNQKTFFLLIYPR